MGWIYSTLRTDQKYIQNWQCSASYLARFLLSRQSKEIAKQLRKLQVSINIHSMGKCSEKMRH
jgi:hypothetical protein